MAKMALFLMQLWLVPLRCTHPVPLTKTMNAGSALGNGLGGLLVGLLGLCPKDDCRPGQYGEYLPLSCTADIADTWSIDH